MSRFRTRHYVPRRREIISYEPLNFYQIRDKVTGFYYKRGSAMDSIWTTRTGIGMDDGRRWRVRPPAWGPSHSETPLSTPPKHSAQELETAEPEIVTVP